MQQETPTGRIKGDKMIRGIIILWNLPQPFQPASSPHFVRAIDINPILRNFAMLRY